MKRTLVNNSKNVKECLIVIDPETTIQAPTKTVTVSALEQAIAAKKAQIQKILKSLDQIPVIEQEINEMIDEIQGIHSDETIDISVTDIEEKITVSALDTLKTTTVAE